MTELKLLAGRRRALTLVELLVATALGVILVGVITFVWLQSSRIFSSTVNRLEAYQRLRAVLDQIERDLANTTRTVDMEFYVDANNNGQYDHGSEQLVVPEAAGTAGAAGTPPASAFASGTGGAYRAPRISADPLNGLTEFEESDNPSNTGFSEFPYFYAPIVFSPPPYEIDQDDYLTDRWYWRDEVMVRSFAMAEGINRPAIIHYRLVRQVSNGRSALRRRIWYLNENGKMVLPSSTTAGTDQVTFVAENLCDLKIGFFFKESESSTTGSSQANGYWYHVGDPVRPDSGALVDLDIAEGWVDAIRGDGPPNFERSLSEQHRTYSQFSAPGGPALTPNAVTFFYGGAARIEEDTGQVVLRTIDENGPTAGLPAAPSGYTYLSPQPQPHLAKFQGTGPGQVGPIANADQVYNNFDFPGVRAGDKILVYDAHDDDAIFVPQTGNEVVLNQDIDRNGSATNPNANYPDRWAGTVFPDRVLTIDAIVSDLEESYIGVKFLEPVSFYRLRRLWLDSEPAYTVTVPGYASSSHNVLNDPQGPPRRVSSSFNCRYRVGFLPAAFRVRLSIDDRFNRRVIPMERVIRLLAH